MKPQLNPGLHISIVTNPRAGQGGSLFAAENYWACHHYGIPALIASFDPERNYPLPGRDLRRLPVCGISQDLPLTAAQRYCLLPVVEEAREQNKMLIIDTRSGFSESHPMFEILREAAIEDADSITALVGVQHGMLDWDGIRNLCHPFCEIGARFGRGLVRDWGLRRDAASSVPSFAEPLLYRWSPPFLTQPMLERINAGAGSSTGPEDLRNAAKAPGELTLTLDDELERKLMNYHRAAREAIWQAVLSPITRLD